MRSINAPLVVPPFARTSADAGPTGQERAMEEARVVRLAGGKLSESGTMGTVQGGVQMRATEWWRVSRRHPCSICAKGDWCTVSADGSAVCRMRVQSPTPMRNGGWLHRLRESSGSELERRGNVIQRIVVQLDRPSAHDFGRLAADFATRIRQEQVESLAGQLDVSELSLHQLGVGYDGCAFAFPMKDASDVVVGIRRRLPSGRKCAVRGSRNGLFIPTELSEIGPLLICEGESDTAALLTLGFNCVGRPSCTGGVSHIVRLVRGRNVVLCADADEPGQRGAANLASVLRLYCPRVRIIKPPDGIKDARAWLQAGGTHRDIQAAIDAAPVMQLKTKVRTVGVS